MTVGIAKSSLNQAGLNLGQEEDGHKFTVMSSHGKLSACAKSIKKTKKAKDYFRLSAW